MAAAMRMHRMPDVMKDFIHIGRIANSDLTVVARPMPPRAHAGGAAGTSAAGSPMPGFASGVKGRRARHGGAMTAGVHPVQGGHESVNAVIGKQVDFALAISSVASLPQVQAGKVVALAVSGPQPPEDAVQVPTFAGSRRGHVAAVRRDSRAGGQCRLRWWPRTGVTFCQALATPDAQQA